MLGRTLHLVPTEVVLGKRTGSQGHCHLTIGGGTKEFEEGLTLSDAGGVNGTEELAR